MLYSSHATSCRAVPPPSYHRREVQAQAQRARALHINVLTLIETLHLLALRRLAVQLAHRRCPPPLPKGAGGRPRTDRDESLGENRPNIFSLPCCKSHKARRRHAEAASHAYRWLSVSLTVRNCKASVARRREGRSFRIRVEKAISFKSIFPFGA
jgi:hypothetical protein